MIKSNFVSALCFEWEAFRLDCITFLSALSVLSLARATTIWKQIMRAWKDGQGAFQISLSSTRIILQTFIKQKAGWGWVERSDRDEMKANFDDETETLYEHNSFNWIFKRFPERETENATKAKAFHCEHPPRRRNQEGVSAFTVLETRVRMMKRKHFFCIILSTTKITQK